jgi:two-component system sensor histidine kinase KdpD
VLRALAVAALCTLLATTLLPYFDLASVTTVYLAGVVLVAARSGASAVLVAVLSSALLFDLLLVAPRGVLKPTLPQYYFAFIVMLLVGMLVSRLAERARQQARVAQARARRAQALNELASHLVGARSERDIADGLAAALRSTFGGACALLLPDGSGRLADEAGFCRGRAESSLAQRAFDEGGATKAATAPATGELLCLPLHGAGGTLGVLAARLPAQRFGTPEDRRLLDAFANQAALALERSLFEQRSAKAVIDAEAERMRNTLLSSISHDFRTPLTTIVGSTSSLLEQGAALGDGQRRRLLRGILDEARRMHASMSDLLDLTRMEAGAVQVDTEWCPAEDLIDEAREALGERLRQRSLRVSVPPDAVVWCDARLVGQALVNLLDNALRHTPPPSAIELRVELAQDVWRLVVADDGPGLPVGQENTVFRKFSRARGELAGVGTGLGLAICAAVARLHGGAIEARNDGGARFTMTLPQPGAPSAALGEGA